MPKLLDFVKKPSGTGLVAAALALAISACGNVGQVSADSQSAAVAISSAEKSSLEGLEESSYQNSARWRDCVSSASPFYLDASGLVGKINPVIGKMAEIAPPAGEVSLLDAPPRGENSVGVFLCNGMSASANALYRTVSISNDFIGKLKEAVRANGGGNDEFVSGLAFVIYHEIGHAVLNHSALKLRGDAKFGLPQELEADQFALDMMAALGISTKGVETARSVADVY
jgi:hypothetical protein